MDNIISEIRKSKPMLPKDEILSKIEFKWNDNELDTWDGGFDLNEIIRNKVVDSLKEELSQKDETYAEILRFLLKQEIENCCESEMYTEYLGISYDNLSSLKLLQDIPLLLSALDDTSFDANMALFKNRLFYNGYDKVKEYLEQNKSHFDEEIIDRIGYYAEILDLKNK